MAPIHLLPNRGGHLDRWRGVDAAQNGAGGMNNPAGTYTHLETLLLWESILREGVDPAGWTRISDKLTKNDFVKQNPAYDANRLKPEPLQTHLFKTLQAELGDNGRQNEEVTSPGGTKRRRLDGERPLPGLKELAENLDLIPAIIHRSWERYKQHQVSAIKEDEVAFEKTSLEVKVLEKNEKERLDRLPAQQPVLAPKESKPAVPPTAPVQSPVPTPAQAAASKRPSPKLQTPVAPPKPPTPIAPPQLPAGASTPQPSPAAQASNGTGVLQAPGGPPPQQPPHSQQPQRVLQAPAPAPPKAISPRPEAAKAKDKAPQAAKGPPAPPADGQLNWQPAYQPQVPQGAQLPQRQTQSPAPPRVATPQQYAQHQQQHWHNQATQQQYTQGQVTAPQQHPSPHQQQVPQQGKPPLAAPQNAGQTVPQIQPGPPRPTGAAPSPQPRPQSKTPVPPPHRPIQPQIQQPRPIAASPTPGTAQSGFPPPQPQRWPQGHVPPGQRISPAVSPAPAGAHGNKPTQSPYAAPRPPIPEHMIRHAASTTPQARRASAAAAVAPTTPVSQLNINLGNLGQVRGFGTKWAPTSTPSTPRPLVEEPASPAYEQISPQLRPATLPRSRTMPLQAKASSQVRQPPLSATVPKGKRTRKLKDATAVDARRRSESVTSAADELSMDFPEPVANIKNEETTPRPNDEIGDTTADESTSGRPMPTPGSVSRVLKRKRQDTPAEPPGPPTHVLWTRGFIKVSSSAIEHISSHKDGNMFASAIRDKDAPNYSQIVLQPQHLNSIRSAVKQGNRAAVQAASALPGGDPGTPSVWLPISEDLTPPRGIVNSGQLEREVMHMLSNAIMYNPDPDKGFSRHFLQTTAEEETDAVGYQFDENAFVHNTRTMFVEVEQNLSDLRSAEKDRTAGGPPPLSTPNVATPADDTAEEEDELAADGENHTSGTAKRRRTGTLRG